MSGHTSDNTANSGTSLAIGSMERFLFIHHKVPVAYAHSLVGYGPKIRNQIKTRQVTGCFFKNTDINNFTWHLQIFSDSFFWPVSEPIEKNEMK